MLQNVTIPKVGAEVYFGLNFTRREDEQGEYLVCQQCPTLRIKRDELDAHLHVHLDCDMTISGQRFHLIRLLRNTKTSAYLSGDAIVICPRCDGHYRYKRFKEHGVSHVKTDPCLFKDCNALVAGRDGLRKHIEQKHGTYMPDDKQQTSAHAIVLAHFPFGIKESKVPRSRTTEERKDAAMMSMSMREHQKERSTEERIVAQQNPPTKSILRKGAQRKYRPNPSYLKGLGIDKEELEVKKRAAEDKADKERKEREAAGKQAAKDRQEKQHRDAKEAMKSKRDYSEIKSPVKDTSNKNKRRK